MHDDAYMYVYHSMNDYGEGDSFFEIMWLLQLNTIAGMDLLFSCISFHEKKKQQDTFFFFSPLHPPSLALFLFFVWLFKTSF